MNNRAPRTVFKVDSVILQSNNENSRLVIYNINVPDYLLTQNETLLQTLTRVKDLLVRDFEDLPVVYQISASYILAHNVTGQIKTWTGSFFAKNNRAGLIADFQNFNSNSFVTTSIDNLQDIDTKLQWNGLDTKWEYQQLLSVIFNVQCTVPNTHQSWKEKFRSQNQIYQTFIVP
jgi:hypothetical protein